MISDKITKTLQLIKNDRSLEDHFFKKLSVASKPLEWLVPLQNAGYFDPNKNPRPQELPDKKGIYVVQYWNILDALKNMAIKNEEKPSDEISNILSKIVTEIINYQENRERIRNDRTDWRMIEVISHFPIKYLNEQHIKFIKDALNNTKGSTLIDNAIGEQFLPKLIKEKAKQLIIDLLDVILHYTKSNNKYIREYVSVIDIYYMKETIDNNKKGISEICAIEAANVAIKKMKAILRKDNTQFNVAWIPTIEDHEQSQFLSDRYESQIVHFVRDVLETADPNSIKSIIEDMLYNKHDIFKRLAYHLINYHYNKLSYLFWKIKYNPINNSYIHEIYELIKNHCKDFDKKQINTILNWIENQKFDFLESDIRDPEQNEQIKAYYKKEWLIALKDSDNDEVNHSYEYYNSINNAEIEHPGFHIWSSGAGFVRDVSPIDESEFKKKTNIELVSYINSYKEEDKPSSMSFTRTSLSSAVRKFVSNDPFRFSSDLTPFLNIPRKYQYEFLRGFEEAWRNNKDFDWNELLSFMKKLIADEKIWNQEKEEGGDNYNRWITDTIADLIWEGTKHDNHAFSPEFLPIAEEIILLLFKNVKGEMSLKNEFITAVINSSKGKAFMAGINYSLRYARLYGQDKKGKWKKNIKSIFTEFLDKTKESGLEFSIIMGWHIPQLYYLDKDWLFANINKILDISNDKYWEAAFIGYLDTTSMIYEDIYKLLHENGHYEKGLSTSFNDKEATRKLVQNIAIGYLAGWDDFVNANSLLRKLFETNNIEYISELVNFIWLTYKDRHDREIESKIKTLWKVLIEKITPHLETNEYRIVASNLRWWLSLVDKIDEDVYNWLQTSVEATEENGGSGFFIEYLHRHVSKTPAKVGILYFLMLKRNNCPIYKKENIIAIIQKLYDLNEKETANKICNYYYDKGFEFLIDVFERNN